jgi:hypothetical protein
VSVLQSAPSTVRASFWLWIASVVISAIAVIVALAIGVPETVGTADGSSTGAVAGSAVVITAILSLVVGGGLRVLFAIFLLRGRNWARIVLVIIAAITVFGSVAAIATGDVIQLIVLLIVVAAAVLMFLPASNAYFRKRA